MSKKLEWPVLIGGGVVCYIIDVVVGGVIGGAFQLLGFFLIVMGLIDVCRKLFKKKNRT